MFPVSNIPDLSDAIKNEEDFDKRAPKEAIAAGITKDFVVENFDDMNLREDVLSSVKVHSFDKPTPLQRSAIAPLATGYDVVIQTYPGMSKKTTVSLAILQVVDTNLRDCQALVLVPSATAAERMQQTVADMGDCFKVRCHSCTGGKSLKEDVSELKEGTHVVVGTLERIYDLINRGALKKEQIKILAIEGAEEFLSGIFKDQIYDIIIALRSRAQLILLSEQVEECILDEFNKVLRSPYFLIANNEVQIIENKNHFYKFVSNERSKAEALLSWDKNGALTQAIIFCCKDAELKRIKTILGTKNKVSVLRKGLCQKERQRILDEFRSSSIDTLITSDSFESRELGQVTLVINYSFPVNIEDYIVRTSLRECSSSKYHNNMVVISFVTDGEMQMMQSVEKYCEIKIVELPNIGEDLCTFLESARSGFLNFKMGSEEPGKQLLQRYNCHVGNSFEDMNLRKELLQGMYEYGFKNPTDLQRKALIPCANGYDVIIHANQRSSKTTTLAIAVLQNIDTRVQHCQALVLTSTREMAQDAHEALGELGRRMRAQCRVFVGGNPTRLDFPTLEKCIHVVAGTAGRIMDLIERKILKPNHIKLLALEDTSELLSRQQRDQTRKIFEALDSGVQIISSTTITPGSNAELWKKFVKEPCCTVVQKNEIRLRQVKQLYLSFVRENLTFETITNLYVRLTVPQSVIFCNRKGRPDYEESKTSTKPLTEDDLFDGVGSKEREIITREFCSVCDHTLFSTSFLKGKSDRVSVIINYDLLTKKENYVHSIDTNCSYFHKGIVADIDPSKEKLEIKDLGDFFGTNGKRR